MSRPFKYFIVALGLLVGAGGLTLLHLENRRLERRLSADAKRAGELARLRDDNARLAQLLALARENSNYARASVRQEIERTRAEIAVLERKAAEQHRARTAMTSRNAVMLATNRDPRRGPARLEHFQNRGQSTPSAALETLVWAALKGDEATLGQVTTLNAATRAKADALLALLPDETRAKWTPEKLGQLWFTGLFTELPALEIAGESVVGATEAIVRLRLPTRDVEEKLSLRLTPAGWKVLVPGAAVDHLKQKLQPAK